MQPQPATSEDQPVLFRFRFMRGPGHTYVQLFAGKQESSLGLCGNLTFRHAEWAALREKLIHMPNVECVPEVE